MSETRKTRTPVFKEPEENFPNVQMNEQNSPNNPIESPLSPAERYLKRKIEVSEQDHEESGVSRREARKGGGEPKKRKRARAICLRTSAIHRRGAGKIGSAKFPNSGGWHGSCR